MAAEIGTSIRKVQTPDGVIHPIHDERIPAVDTTPTSGSTNVVESGGIKEAIMESAGEVIIGTQTAATGNWTGVSKLATASDMKSGYRFTYWLPYAGSGNATLTLTFQDGTTKAIDCYIRGASRLTTHIPAGNKVDFCYLEDASVAGTKYTGAWIDPGYWDGNSYDSIYSNYERRFIYSTATPLYRYKICGYNNGKIVPLVVTNQTSATIVDKTPVTVGLDPYAGLVIYNTTTNITSTSSAIGSLYNELAANGFSQYTFNDNVPAYKDVYLKGTIGEDGLFYLDTTTHKSWYVFAPNRESDGEYNSVFEGGSYYMFVGPTYSSANYFQLKYNNQVYLFNGEKLVTLEEVKFSEVKEETEFLYRKSPSITQGYYSAKEIKGKTLVWNQLIVNGNLSNGTNGWSRSGSSTILASNGVLTVTITATPTSNYTGYVAKPFSKTSGHKYYFHVEVNVPHDGRFILDTNSEIQTQLYDVSANKWEKLSSIASAVRDGLSGFLFPRELSDGYVSGDSFKIRNYYVIDLTLMFGAGNEPATVEEFESMFPLPYYDYNPGELISFNAEGIKTVGFNQWDEEWGRGDIDGAGNMPGQNIVGVYLRSKNYIPAFPNTMYCISSVNEQGDAARRWVVYEYDDAKNFLGYTSLNSLVATFTTKAKTRFFRFRNNKDTTTYYNDICINISEPSKNGTYEPYKKSTLTLDIASMTSGGVQIFPDGMRSAGDVYDEAIVDPDGYIRNVTKRIGGVLLNGGNGQSYGIQSINEHGIANFTYYAEDRATGSIAAIICDKLVRQITTIADTTDEGFLPSNGTVIYLRIKETSASTISELKTYLASNPVYFAYELATPVEYTLDNPIFVGTEYYSGGIQKILPENTSEPTTAPFRGKLGYRDYSYVEKQDKLTFDTAPTANSANPVTSGGLYTELADVIRQRDMVRLTTTEITNLLNM